jgi:lipoprotein
MKLRKMTGGLVMIVSGCLMLEPGNCLGYQIFNFLDGKNWRNEMGKSIDFKVFKDHNWVGIAYVKDDIGQIQGFKFMYKGPEKLKDTYEKGDYFRAEVLGFEYDLVFERDFWYDLDKKTSEYGLEFRILW